MSGAPSPRRWCWNTSGTTASTRRRTWWTSWCIACARKSIRTRRGFTPFAELDMPSGLLNRVSIRLSLWYTAFFAVSTTTVLLLMYYLVAQELERKEIEVIQSRAKEYASLLQTRGYTELKRRVLVENDPANERAFFVSVVSPYEVVNYVMVPQDFGSLRLEGRVQRFLQQTDITRIPKDAQKDLALVRVLLPNGGNLFVGR